MSKKRYVVELSADERKRLEELTRKGKSPAKKQLKARIRRPILMCGSANTTSRGRIKAAGASAKRRCKRSLTQCRWRRRK